MASERSTITTTTFTSRLESVGLQVDNIARDGSCMFASVAHQLELRGINKSAAQVRQDIVDFISGNPTVVCEGVYFIARLDLNTMSAGGHFSSGDNIITSAEEHVDRDKSQCLPNFDA
jgi:hypothetical protein